MSKQEDFVRDFIEEFNIVLGEILKYEDLKPKERIQMLQFANKMFKRGWFKK